MENNYGAAIENLQEAVEWLYECRKEMIEQTFLGDIRNEIVAQRQTLQILEEDLWNILIDRMQK